PGRERAAGAGNDDGVDGGLLLRVAKRVAQLVPHLTVEGVPLLRAVQGEDEDGAVALLENGLAHAAVPYRSRGVIASSPGTGRSGRPFPRCGRRCAALPSRPPRSTQRLEACMGPPVHADRPDRNATGG